MRGQGEEDRVCEDRRKRRESNVHVKHGERVVKGLATLL